MYLLILYIVPAWSLYLFCFPSLSCSLKTLWCRKIKYIQTYFILLHLYISLLIFTSSLSTYLWTLSSLFPYVYRVLRRLCCCLLLLRLLKFNLISFHLFWKFRIVLFGKCWWLDPCKQSLFSTISDKFVHGNLVTISTYAE